MARLADLKVYEDERMERHSMNSSAYRVSQVVKALPLRGSTKVRGFDPHTL